MTLDADDLKKIRSIVRQEWKTAETEAPEDRPEDGEESGPACEAALWSIQDLMERSEISRSTVYRRIDRWGLDRCDAQGYPKPKGDRRATFIFSRAWVNRAPVGTRQRRNALRRAGKI